MHPGAERGAESGSVICRCVVMVGLRGGSKRYLMRKRSRVPYALSCSRTMSRKSSLATVGSVIVQLHYLGFAQFEFALVKRVDRDILEPRLRQAKVGTDGAGYRYEDDRKRRDGVR